MNPRGDTRPFRRQARRRAARRRAARLPAVRLPAARLQRVGWALLAVLLVVAALAPWLAPYDPAVRVGMPFQAPSAAHLLGTDDVGHDLFSQLLVGARPTLFIGLVAATVAVLVGTALGLLAGELRGVVDNLVMRLVDVVLAMPLLPLMIVVGVFLGPGMRTQILVISMVMWAAPARELRAQVLSTRERGHVEAARTMGARTVHVLGSHVLPNVLDVVAPQFVLAARRAILFEAALSFLGLGAVDVVTWGSMLFTAHARSAFLTSAWRWWVVPPGVAIALTVLAFALIGQRLEAWRRPRRTRGSVRARHVRHEPSSLADNLDEER